MKSLRIMMMGLAAAGVITALSTISYADDAQDQAKIKTLNDAAAALQQSSPDLAAGLTKFAIDEAAEIKGKEDQKEPEEKNEAGENTQRIAHIKLLRDAGSALKLSHPELALSLMEMADRSEKKMMNEGKEDKDEKENKS